MKRQWMMSTASLFLALAVAVPAAAAQPDAKQVRELFNVMHMSQMFGNMNTQMAGVMGRAVPCVPSAYWQKFIDASGSEQLLDRMVPIYQQHFSADEVSGLLTFYRSPLGQKVITEMPLTMAEGMKAGQTWGRERGQAMIEALKHKGTLDGNGRCPASPAVAPKPVK